MTRVAAYCRVSTDSLDQAGSFENQKSFFEEYISRHAGWELFAIYADEGVTGTQAEKARRLSAHARRRAARCLTSSSQRSVAFPATCLTRSTTRASCGAGGSFSQRRHLHPRRGRGLRLGIMAAVAQEESRRTSERVRWGQLRRMEKGVVFGRSLLGMTSGRRADGQRRGRGACAEDFRPVSQ